MRQCECKTVYIGRALNNEGVFHCGICGYPLPQERQAEAREYRQRQLHTGSFRVAGRVLSLAGVIQRVDMRERGVSAREFFQMVQPRRHGKTTQQMLAALRGAHFIWSHGPLDYPRELAASLGRSDLTIVRLDWLTRRDFLGVEPTGVVVDHSVRLSVRHQVHLEEAMRRVRARGGASAKGPKA